MLQMESRTLRIYDPLFHRLMKNEWEIKCWDRVWWGEQAQKQLQPAEVGQPLLFKLSRGTSWQQSSPLFFPWREKGILPISAALCSSSIIHLLHFSCSWVQHRDRHCHNHHRLKGDVAADTRLDTPALTAASSKTMARQWRLKTHEFEYISPTEPNLIKSTL